MFCTHCGREIPEEALFCTYCGAPVARETPEKRPGGVDSGRGHAQDRPGGSDYWQRDHRQRQYRQGDGRYQDGRYQGDRYPDYHRQQYYPPWQDAPEPHPANVLLANWETNVGFSILGIVISGLVSMTGVGAYVVLIAGIWYAAKAYPSYFGDRPLFTDPRVVAACNLGLGGIVFGCIWNSNLTNRKMGISHKVYIGLTIAGIVLGILAGVEIAVYGLRNY